MTENNPLNHLKSHLKSKVVILGIGNTLRSDDGVGSILASRIRDKVPFIVFDAGATPENYLGRVIKEKPDVILIVDAVDFGGRPGELELYFLGHKTAPFRAQMELGRSSIPPSNPPAYGGGWAPFEGKNLKAANLFFTHNTSLEVTTNYLQSNLGVDIMILAIQPKSVIFGDTLSPEIEQAMAKLEGWFNEYEKAG